MAPKSPKMCDVAPMPTAQNHTQEDRFAHETLDTLKVTRQTVANISTSRALHDA